MFHSSLFKSLAFGEESGILHNIFFMYLSDEKRYPSFFSLIREVLCSTRDHRMTLLCLEKTIRKWAVSPGAALNDWFLNVSDWNNGLVTALNFLAGTYQGMGKKTVVQSN